MQLYFVLAINNSGILLKDGGMRINIKKIKKINK